MHTCAVAASTDFFCLFRLKEAPISPPVSCGVSVPPLPHLTLLPREISTPPPPRQKPRTTLQIDSCLYHLD